MRYISWNGKPEVDTCIFNDPQFANFRVTLDGEMDRLQAESIWLKSWQTEIDEEMLWKKTTCSLSTGQFLCA